MMLLARIQGLGEVAEILYSPEQTLGWLLDEVRRVRPGWDVRGLSTDDDNEVLVQLNSDGFCDKMAVGYGYGKQVALGEVIDEDAGAIRALCAAGAYFPHYSPPPCFESYAVARIAPPSVSESSTHENPTKLSSAGSSLSNTSHTFSVSTFATPSPSPSQSTNHRSISSDREATIETSCESRHSLSWGGPVKDTQSRYAWGGPGQGKPQGVLLHHDNRQGSMPLEGDAFLIHALREELVRKASEIEDLKLDVQDRTVEVLKLQSALDRREREPAQQRGNDLVLQSRIKALESDNNLCHKVAASLRAQIKVDRERHESIVHALESRVGQLETERNLSRLHLTSADAHIEELTQSLQKHWSSAEARCKRYAGASSPKALSDVTNGRFAEGAHMQDEKAGVASRKLKMECANSGVKEILELRESARKSVVAGMRGAGQDRTIFGVAYDDRGCHQGETTRGLIKL